MSEPHKEGRETGRGRDGKGREGGREMGRWAELVHSGSVSATALTNQPAGGEGDRDGRGREGRARRQTGRQTVLVVVRMSFNDHAHRFRVVSPSRACPRHCVTTLCGHCSRGQCREHHGLLSIVSQAWHTHNRKHSHTDKVGNNYHKMLSTRRQAEIKRTSERESEEHRRP